MNEPNSLIAGNSYNWKETSATYTPKAGWSLIYYFNGPSKGTVTGSKYDDETFQVTASAAFTNTLAIGTYTMTGLLSASTDRYSFSTTVLEVKQNPSTAPAGYDARSHAKKCLDLIEAAIESITPDGVVSLSIAGRSRTNYSVAELLKLKNYYEAQVRNEEATERMTKGMPGKSQIFIRF